MENASKALLMAAGVLIGIIIIGALVFMASNLSSIPSAQEKEKQAEQIAEFNKVYESYDKKKLRGSEVVSIINRVIDNNEQNADKQIEVYVTVKANNKANADELSAKQYKFAISDKTIFVDLFNDKDRRNAFMYSRLFECTNITYNSQSGRVNGIYFEEYINEEYIN